MNKTTPILLSILLIFVFTLLIKDFIREKNINRKEAFEISQLMVKGSLEDGLFFMPVNTSYKTFIKTNSVKDCVYYNKNDSTYTVYGYIRGYHLTTLDRYKINYKCKIKKKYFAKDKKSIYDLIYLKSERKIIELEEEECDDFNY